MNVLHLLSCLLPCIICTLVIFLLVGAVELWELLDNESLLVNKFTKYEHDDIVTSLSVFTGGSQAVSGSKDFRYVLNNST